MTQTIRKILTRDFVLTFFGLFTLGSVFHIMIPTLPIYLSTLGSTEFEIGIIIGIFGLSSLVVRPLVGRALIKTPERKLMIAGTLLHVFISVAYIFAPPFWPILGVRMLQGIGFASFHTASFTLIAKMSSEAHRAQTLSYVILSFNLASAIAPSLGVFLINHFGFTCLFLVCLALSLCSFFISLQLEKKEVVQPENIPTEDGFLLSRQAVVPSVISSFALFSWGAVATFFPLHAISHGISNPGFFFTVVAVVLIMSRALGGRILNVSQKEKVILPCLMTYVLSAAILSFSTTMPMFILVAVLWGLGHGFLMPMVLTYAVGRGSSPGPAMGTFHAISDIGLFLGPVTMGMVVRWTSYPFMFLTLAFISIANLIYFYLFVRKTGV
jgi:predicted MFS family arabinose efflux permease